MMVLTTSCGVLAKFLYADLRSGKGVSDMTRDQKQQVALFRYSVIAPLETGTSDPSISNNEFFRQAAKKTYTGPNGKPTTVGTSTVEKWHRAYRKGGFDALLPQSQSDEGISRKPSLDHQAQIRYLKTEHPRIAAAEIYCILLSNGSIHIGQFSVSTVECFVRYDNFENLMTVIRSAVSRYGRPRLFAFDNGSSYRNKQMEFLVARIGSSVHYCEPFTPTSKSKIERWFLTLRVQYFAPLDMRDFHTLEELRKDFYAYVAGITRRYIPPWPDRPAVPFLF